MIYCFFLFILLFSLESGKVINWGRNTYGQLGCHDHQRPASWKPLVMDSMDHVKQLSVGSEHNIAILGKFLSYFIYNNVPSVGEIICYRHFKFML